MRIKLDMTSKFNVAVDYTGVSDLHTYIDIGLTDDLKGELSFSLINFILNLDSRLISELKSSGFYSPNEILEDGFFIIKKAVFLFSNINGGDAEFYDYKGREDRASFYKTWEYSLSNGNRVYEIGGGLNILPEINVSLYIVSSDSVMMSFDLNDAIYLNTYNEFISNVHLLNQEKINLIKNNKPGLFFNKNFRDKYILRSLNSDELIIKSPEE